MKTRTSQSHPLQIAEVQLGSGMGKVGLTFCPGKKQEFAFTGHWDRDLKLDLEAIAAWNAAALVTLIEEHEFAMLSVNGLGEAARDHHMLWYHLPIRDVSVPSQSFEDAWQTVGEGLRAILRDGFNVLVHCKGGLGRAGMTAARLLIELGIDPQAAITSVREVRPGAIETPAQVQYVRQLTTIMEQAPEATGEAQEDRALGAMLGLAVGDAVGTTYEFQARDRNPRLVDLVGGGPFRLKTGEWTDDTAMALALMDSLLAHPDLDEGDLMGRFTDWYEHGTYSCTGKCFDIGITTRQALGRANASGNPVAGSTDPRSAGNGSLMRLAPVAVRHWRNREALRDIAARQSRTTHGAAEAVDACAAFAEVLADAIEGRPRSEVLRPRAGQYAGKIESIMTGSWRGKHRDQVGSSGYVAHSLEAALWSVGRTDTFRDAVLLAANLADDADTTAAITGQLAGALYGASGIPQEWRGKLAWGARIGVMAHDLLDAGTRRST